MKPERTWRARKDAFEEVWPEVLEIVERDEAVEAKMVFEYLCRQHPERFQEGELDHTFPDILPGGHALLLTTASDYTHPKIAVQSLQTGQRRILLEGIKPRFVPTGHIVFARAVSFWASASSARRSLDIELIRAYIVEVRAPNQPSTSSDAR